MLLRDSGKANVLHSRETSGRDHLRSPGLSIWKTGNQCVPSWATGGSSEFRNKPTNKRKIKRRLKNQGRVWCVTSPAGEPGPPG